MHGSERLFSTDFITDARTRTDKRMFPADFITDSRTQTDERMFSTDSETDERRETDVGWMIVQIELAVVQWVPGRWLPEGAGFRPAEGQHDSCNENDDTKHEAAEVIDEVADEFPFAAKPVAKATVQEDPGGFASDVVGHEFSESKSAASGNEVGGNG